MIEFQVEGMSCGGCASRIARAVQNVDGAAKVHVDLPGKTVRVESHADLDVIRSAIVSLGYPVTSEDVS